MSECVSKEARDGQGCHDTRILKFDTILLKKKQYSIPFPTVLVQNKYCTHTLISVQTWVENLIGLKK